MHAPGPQILSLWARTGIVTAAAEAEAIAKVAKVALESIMAAGGAVIDSHTVDFFPERWFDLVAVLRCDNDVLYPRLEARCGRA